MAQTQSSELKQRILQAAERILDTDGSSAMTVRSVAAAAGCSTIGVYTHFRDKAGLIEAIIADGFTAFGTALATATPNRGTAGLIATAVAYRGWALANRTKYLVMLSPLVAGFEPPAHLVDSTGQVLGDHIERVRDAVAAGEITGDPEQIARHLWATVHGHVMLELNQPRADPALREHEFLLAMEWIFHGVARPPTAPSSHQH